MDAYGYYTDEYGEFVPVSPARPHPRMRHASEHHRRPPMYHVGSSGHLAPAPAFGTGLHRSVSAAGPRVPVQVTIHNTQTDETVLARPRDPDWDYDDDWDERAHSPVRYEHSRSRSRARHEHSRPRHSRSRSRAPARTYGSRDASPYYRDFEVEQKLEKLRILEKQEEEAETKKRLEEQLLLKKAKEEAAKAAKEKEEKELKKKAIEEDRLKQKEKEEKDKKEKKEAEEHFREEVKKKFGAAGWSEETIEEILNKGKHGDQTKVVAISSQKKRFKVHRDHMLPEVLDTYKLPWDWYEVSGCIVFAKNIGNNG